MTISCLRQKKTEADLFIISFTEAFFNQTQETFELKQRIANKIVELQGARGEWVRVKLRQGWFIGYD